VYLDIEEILSYFNITFQISYHYNPGDDDSLWVGYVLENKKLDYCNFPDLEDFVNPIINLRGYRSFHNLKEEFESDRSTYENKIPTILETVKTEFKKNYVLKKEMDYEYKLTPILRQEIIHSICMDGWDKTINSLEKIFDKFTQKAKQTSFPIKYSLSMTGNK
ncbi:hypothetical protein, partial [Flavobacterium sp.]|uniref:hypothetical protein n=1 Tax=Flavobacterium sp. TaxID=239 RepID=UPI000EBD96BA